MLERLADGLWQPWLLGLFLAAGAVCTLFGVFGGLCVRRRRKRGGAGPKEPPSPGGGGLTQRQAFFTALASTIGTGSIAGVATAIFFGGPGAVFWMWASAAVGLGTSFVEKFLAVQYRGRTAGGWEGGPMEYMTRALGWKRAAGWFSFWCVGASLTGGAMVQSNSISAALESAFGWDRLAVGLAVALCAGAVIFGGIRRVGRVSEALVPVMAGLFLATGTLVILAHRERVVPVLGSIFSCAFSGKALAGGGLGYTVSAALRYGVARGVFTNEAGVGSSAMAHAAADTRDPVKEGLLGMFEVFFATVLVCGVTALTILTSGVYDPNAALAAIREGTVTGTMTGAPLSAAAFATVLGQGGRVVVAVCLLLFAFTSLLGWCYYGERGLSSLAGSNQLRGVFRAAFLVTVVLGSVGRVERVWALSDLCNGLMAIPNLLALTALAPRVGRQTRGRQ